MVYCGTNITETIWFGKEEVHYVELTKANDKSIFYVTIDYDENWVWAFNMNGLYNYEIIKHTIVDIIDACDNVGELINVLDVIFMEEFADIIIEIEDQDECKCNGDCCESCNHRDCLN